MNRQTVIGCILLGTALFSIRSTADISVDQEGKVKLQADLRLRYESDWDSQKEDGTMRSDRGRVRIRMRGGMKLSPSDWFEAGVRLRTGSHDSQQSPHITVVDLDGNSNGDQELLLDKWYAKVVSENASVWAGRNNMPFWKQNEFLWDDDVTVAGGALAYGRKLGDSKVEARAGYFFLPDGGIDFNGTMVAGQLICSAPLGPVGVTVAGGLLSIEGASGAEEVRSGNGGRDYAILTGSLQAKQMIREIPLVLGVDVMHNSEHYSSTDDNEFTAANSGETEGYVLSAKLGDLKGRGKWLLAYYYAYIEALAVNASYAQDDWVRWGSATQTDSSDLKGHEIRIGYGLAENINILGRLYLVDAITSDQDGNRARIDLNIKF